MTFLRPIDYRVFAFVTFAGFIIVAFVALNAAVSGSDPGRGNPPSAPSNLPLAQATADVPAVAPAPESPAATASNACETQNWPYYSGGCLRGEATVEAPRQVHVQPASTTPTPPSTPVTVALADTSTRQATSPRQHSQAPRRRKAQPIQRYASRPFVRERQAQPETFGQALAFSW
ncbi:hypothetical protein FNL55_25985 [Tardiphaga sp. vice352]|uniref:hypothetical protein n=1 Tax=unclassified Tardiphaga TaxID=2631404 RepID=UPI001162A499|nr:MULTISPECIES: hypothetical protein [unclassified Tardiphaga]QDM19107.1 hypothetical protein FNL53_26545 [Tardiphaga sp. vice278]QDM29311.1 hypothetical protein FNL56_26715 [Tardiphaga sp. vice304]QDM34416.1 hypothetical protein FNL55_25985 [Tardiphaga sp. vice352]